MNKKVKGTYYTHGVFRSQNLGDIFQYLYILTNIACEIMLSLCCIDILLKGYDCGHLLHTFFVTVLILIIPMQHLSLQWEVMGNLFTQVYFH